jgi:hypothetical protein
VGHLHFDPCEKSAELLEHEVEAAEVDSMYDEAQLKEYIAEHPEEFRLKTSDEAGFNLFALPEPKKRKR